ncbi:MAG: circularly permuted type 2 ATP-grasp protein [Acidimicrobiales bacterium]
MLFSDYRPTTFDELIDVDGEPREAAAALVRHLERLGMEEIEERQHAADLGIEAAGVTFTVYNEGTGIDRAWPFDIVPRVISRRDWDRVDAGLVQRLVALNHFIADVYGDQRIFADGIVPIDLVANSPGYRPECRGATPRHGVWAHICGSDLVRGADGTIYVLEDNLRVPSGVSYMLENREVTKRVFADLFRDQSILPVDAYPERLRRILASLSPLGDEALIAVLTPGVYNSAYFEHSFLARQMGVELVEGRDLFVDDDVVYMRTIHGPIRVDVLYRRVDDSFLDPEVFRPDSTLGVPGIMGAWRAGNVAIANAPGTGVADDKAVYAYVPDMIRYYLDAEPILSNVPTYQCGRDADRAYVLDHLDELVVKPANESGGYGIIIGPRATSDELEQCAKEIRNDPRGFVAQPVIDLSVVPTLCDGTLAPRHVDLRPFTLLGAESYVTCGGLTRVARVEGSLVVNSSQGGGSKDTWVVDTDAVAAAVSAIHGRSQPPDDIEHAQIEHHEIEQEGDT